MGEHVTALLASVGKTQLEKTHKTIQEARESAKAEYARLKDEKSVAKARAAAKVQYQRLGKDLAQIEAALAQHNGSKQTETTTSSSGRGPGGKFVKKATKQTGAATKKGSQRASAPAPAEQQEQEQDNRPQEEDDASRQAVADARS